MWCVRVRANTRWSQRSNCCCPSIQKGPLPHNPSFCSETTRVDIWAKGSTSGLHRSQLARYGNQSMHHAGWKHLTRAHLKGAWCGHLTVTGSSMNSSVYQSVLDSDVRSSDWNAVAGPKESVCVNELKQSVMKVLHTETRLIRSHMTSLLQLLAAEAASTTDWINLFLSQN